MFVPASGTQRCPELAFTSKGLESVAHTWFHEFFINILLFHNEAWLTQNRRLIKFGFALCPKIPSSSAIHPSKKSLLTGREKGRIQSDSPRKSEQGETWRCSFSVPRPGSDGEAQPP